MYLMMPLVFRNPVYSLAKQQAIYHKKELEGFVIRNMESYHFLTKSLGIAPERIITDANLYVANRESVDFWRELGVKGNTLPLELEFRELEAVAARGQMEAIVYGYIPLMVSAQCMCYNTEGCGRAAGNPGKVLTVRDGRNRRFFVYAGCRYCYNVIYHSEPLVLEQERELFREMGVHRFRTDLTLESPEETERILQGEFPTGQKGHFYRGIE
jgi:putative protease